jgi:hypothetical protein
VSVEAVAARGRRLAAVAQPRLDPIVAFLLWSRAAIWAAALAAWYLRPSDPALPRFVGLAPAHAPPGWQPPWLHDLGPATDVWARWDSAWFLFVAHHGYGPAHDAAAFYPLYPLLVGLLGRALLGHYVVAGIVVSLAATFGSFLLLERLVAAHLGRATARRAVLYLALAPTALFLQAVYSESLFLLLALAAFLLAERGRFLGAGAAAGLALLTRPVAFALLPALALIAWRSPQRRPALARLGVAPLLFALYPLTLWLQAGDPLAFLRAEQSPVWARHVSPAGPLGGIWDGLRAGAASLEGLVTGSGAHVSSQNVLLLASLGLFLALLAVAWRRLDPAWSLFATLALAEALSVPSGRWPLLSLPRFGLVLFPLWVALATLGERPRNHAAILTASTVLLALVTVRWGLWQWVS